MEKQIVNNFFISDLIRKSVCFYDMDEILNIFDDLDVNNEEQMKMVIRYFLLVNYYFQTNEYQVIFKNSLRFCLNTQKCDFYTIFERGMPAFELTYPHQDFFIWIWEVFYKYEDFMIESEDLINFYIESNDERMLSKF